MRGFDADKHPCYNDPCTIPTGLLLIPHNSSKSPNMFSFCTLLKKLHHHKNCIVGRNQFENRIRIKRGRLWLVGDDICSLLWSVRSPVALTARLLEWNGVGFTWDCRTELQTSSALGTSEPEPWNDQNHSSQTDNRIYCRFAPRWIFALPQLQKHIHRDQNLTFMPNWNPDGRLLCLLCSAMPAHFFYKTSKKRNPRKVSPSETSFSTGMPCGQYKWILSFLLKNGRMSVFSFRKRERARCRLLNCYGIQASHIRKKWSIPKVQKAVMAVKSGWQEW